MSDTLIVTRTVSVTSVRHRPECTSQLFGAQRSTRVPASQARWTTAARLRQAVDYKGVTLVQVGDKDLLSAYRRGGRAQQLAKLMLGRLQLDEPHARRMAAAGAD